MVTSFVKAFRKSESGGFTIFSLFIFLSLLIVCGFAVDLIRTERERVALQNIADTAALAASRIDDGRDPATVVRDYFEKAGRLAALSNVHVDPQQNDQVVTITTRTDVDTIFLGLIGHDIFPAVASSQARQGATDIEISLVLDISSSMRNNNRLDNLQDAVRDFAEAVIPLDPFASASDISINVIPYSLNVNPGRIADHFDLSDKHAYGNCMTFENDDFDVLSISRTKTYERYTHMADNSSGYTDGVVNLPMCPDHEILPLAFTRDAVTDAVDALTHWDGTGIDMGVKWGIAMLDPDFRPVVTAMIGETDPIIDARMAGRPYDYGTSKKFLIIMSDGENNSQRDLHEFMRSGPSPIFRDIATGRLSVLVSVDVTASAEDQAALVGVADDVSGDPSGTTLGLNEEDLDDLRWYHVSSDDIEDHPDTAGANGSIDDLNLVATQMVQLSWPDVYNITRTNDIYDEYFKTPHDEGYLTNAQANLFKQPINFDRITEDQTSQRMEDICDEAHANGVEVFAISFDPPSQLAQTTLSDCVNVDGNFFPVNGREISDAFNAIARTIGQVHLTQ